jgi:hypothetical protein
MGWPLLLAWTLSPLTQGSQWQGLLLLHMYHVIQEAANEWQDSMSHTTAQLCCCSRVQQLLLRGHAEAEVRSLRAGANPSDSADTC